MLQDTMRTYRTALLLILCFALPCITQAQTAHLTAAEAKNRAGETATFCGHVASARFAEKSHGRPTFFVFRCGVSERDIHDCDLGDGQTQIRTPRTHLPR